jgi:quaternary ammonium compound-resistance protein SugE
MPRARLWLPDEWAVPGVRQDGLEESVMAWFVLVLSGVLEAVWAVALSKSAGLSRVAPSLVFLVGLALSMGGLAYALRSIPVGTGYAVWVGIGAALTVAYGMAFGAESVTLAKLLLLVGLIGCVTGLKLAH